MRWALAAGLVAAGALALLVRVATSPDEGPAPAPPDVAAPRAQPTSAATQDACRFTLGQRLAFGVAADATLVMHPGALGAADDATKTLVTRTTTTLEARVLAVTPAREAIVALAARDWRDEPAEVAATGAAWADELARPVLLRLDARCRVLASAHHRDASTLAFERVRRLLEPLDMAIVMGGDAAYETRQRDTFGASTWSSRWRAGPERGTLERRRVRFIGAPPRGGDGAGLRSAIRASRASVRLGAGPWIAGLDQEETIVTSHHAVVALESTLRARFDARPPAPDAFVGADLTLAHYVWTTGEGAVAGARDDDAALRGVPLEAAWRSYQEQATRDWFAAQALLRAWLRANPEAIEALAAALAAGRFSPAEQAALVLAMAKSGSVPARQALERLAADARLGEDLRTQATSALADATPSLETVKTLVGLAERQGGSSTQDMVGSAATMTLGTLIDASPGQTPESDAARDYLEARLAAADPKGVSEALWAIGNSGDVGFVDAVTPLVTSADPELRAAAAHALRRMPSNEVAPILAERMRAEAHPEVAAELAAARREQLGRDGRLSETELGLYRSKLLDAPEPLRRELVLALGAASRHQPEARQVLVDWFPNETSLAVKQLIGQFVPAELLL